MPTPKKSANKKMTGSKSITEQERKVCFVISPIGKKGTDQYTRFKEVLDYIIKSAVKASGYELDVLRADDIDRTGSFIKDILESLYTSFVVIADLTEQNANVFYELGVRHSLRPRTILIAQSVDDIPSDLREYRSIVYDMSAKGASDFAQLLKNYLTQIHKEPERPDNPVLDRIGGIGENRIAQLEAENQNLKNELSNILKQGAPKPDKTIATNLQPRINRITGLMNANSRAYGSFTRGDESYLIPGRQGNFGLYFVEDGDKIKEFWYVSVRTHDFDYKDDLADVRVLMEKCVQQGETRCKFIIATENDLSAQSKDIFNILNKMKMKLSPAHRKLFVLEIWDKQGLIAVEKELGLRV